MRPVASLSLALVMLSCPLSAATVADPSGAWQAAHRGGDHAKALTICDRVLAEAAGADGIWLSYRGLSLQALGRHAEAVDSLRRGRARGDHVFDAYFQRALAESLIDLRLYHAAQAVVDGFIDQYPASSPTRQRFISLALKEREGDVLDLAGQHRLLEWVGRSFAAGRSGLALTLAEEVLALHQQSSFADPAAIDEARLHGGLAALQLGLAEQAIAWLDPLDPGFADGKAGLSLALAHLIPGRQQQALDIIDRTLASGPAESIADHCRALQQRLRP